MKVSVIVAAYNIENYIEKCLLSVINQTLKDIEIIVVNDGSNDNTLEKIKEISNNDERIVKKYKCILKDQEDIELNLRKVLLESEKENWMLNSELVFEAALDILERENKVVYTAIMLYKHENVSEGTENVILEKGKYLTMYYDDSYKNNLKYYKMMLDHINKCNIEPIGNFNEFSILSRVNSKEDEKSIIQLEIKIK